MKGRKGGAMIQTVRQTERQRVRTEEEKKSVSEKKTPGGKGKHGPDTVTRGKCLHLAAYNMDKNRGQ